MPSSEATILTIATRLGEIAAGVADEAAEMTRGLREIGDHARDISALATALEETALDIDGELRSQLDAVAAARVDFGNSRPALAALARSAGTIASMSSRVRTIAANSRLLSLNARIEAARHAEGGGFAMVAQAIGDLSGQTRLATEEIDEEARTIEANVTNASGLIKVGNDLADQQHRTISGVATTTTRQHETAAELRRLTSETVERVDDAAIGVGRVSSAASIVGVLARQLASLASRLAGDAVA